MSRFDSLVREVAEGDVNTNHEHNQTKAELRTKQKQKQKQSQRKGERQKPQKDTHTHATQKKTDPEWATKIARLIKHRNATPPPPPPPPPPPATGPITGAVIKAITDNQSEHIDNAPSWRASQDHHHREQRDESADDYNKHQWPTLLAHHITTSITILCAVSRP